jgi:3-methyladenine DNA glycosylase/8-oxoguanine DNA glycosylase
VADFAQIQLPVEGPYDFRQSVSALVHGRGNPTRRFVDGVVWFAARWPDGPATLRLVPHEGGVHAAAWGPGADAALVAAPGIAGLHDDASDWKPEHPLVAELHRGRPGQRMPRSGLVVLELMRTILGQLVTVREANDAWRALVRAYGEPAPGPPDALAGLVLPPDPAVLARVQPWRLTTLGMLSKQAETIRRVCERAKRMEEAAGMSLEDGMRRMQAIRGVGPWTAGSVMGGALGHPDAVVVGDLHLPRTVAFALAGETEADDARMLQLLEPFRGHRQRVVRLLHGSGRKVPRRGPRPEARPAWGRRRGR